MNKQIYRYEDVKDKIREAVDIIADPVRQTLSPMGSNVLYEDSRGDQYSTNDGVTISKNINVKDPLKNAIIEVIKQPALQTNGSVGDGTTTSILLSQVLVKESMKLIDEGMNRMVLKENLNSMGAAIKKRLSKYVRKIEDKEDLYRIAKISANNDDVIATDIAKVIKTAGADGMVFIEPYHKPETELVIDSGFNISCPLSEHLTNGKGFSVLYDNIPVFITDKRFYHKEEAETILRVALESGWNKVAVVARDFIGKSLEYFVANHKNGNIKVLLVQDPNATDKDPSSLVDLSVYLGGKLYSDKQGSLVDKVKKSDFVFAKKIVANGAKTVIVTSKPNNPELKERIKSIKAESDKYKENKQLRARLAALTNGTVTIKVGGRTPIEVQERIFRYEDAVNATRTAMKDGYLVGGGYSLLCAYNEKDHGIMAGVARKFCESSVRQIAENCGKHINTILDAVYDGIKNKPEQYIGYNAKTDEITNLLEDGVVDPYKVTEMAVDNAISITTHLLTSGYFIINDNDETNGKEKQNKDE